jgi:hypothetical protein
MPNYRTRLDNIEAVLCPTEAAAWFAVWIDEGMTLEESATRYALNHGLTVSSVVERGIFARWCGLSETAKHRKSTGFESDRK